MSSVLSGDAGSAELQFQEIEHKFLVDAEYDPKALFALLSQLEPDEQYVTHVRDSYYLVEKAPQLVYRHRIDAFLQELSFKSLGGDNESRTEVNLDLGLKSGDQSTAVTAFLQPLNILWSGTLIKEVHVFYFAEVEVVFYRASFDGRVQSCIEIESRQALSREEALARLAKWEEKLGLDPLLRSKASLLELLMLPSVPATVRQRFKDFLR